MSRIGKQEPVACGRSWKIARTRCFALPNNGDRRSRFASDCGTVALLKLNPSNAWIDRSSTKLRSERPSSGSNSTRTFFQRDHDLLHRIFQTVSYQGKNAPHQFLYSTRFRLSASQIAILFFLINKLFGSELARLNFSLTINDFFGSELAKLNFSLIINTQVIYSDISSISTMSLNWSH